MASFQDRAQHAIAQLDKEVGLIWSPDLCALFVAPCLPLQEDSTAKDNIVLVLTIALSIAHQVPRPEQLGAPDQRPQGVCDPGSGRYLLLPGLLQHRRPVPG